MFFGYHKSYIVFDYGGAKITRADQSVIKSPKIYIKPPRAHHFGLCKPKNSSFITFLLQPTAFQIITGLDAYSNRFNFHSLHDCFTEEELWSFYHWCEHQDDAETIHNQKFEICKEKLAREWNQQTPIDDIIAFIIKNKGLVKIEDILCKYPFSLSTLNRYAKKYIGMTIGLYIRLVKFTEFLRLIDVKDTNINDLVYDFGYFDQSHLVKDFKRFAGITPSEYCGPSHKLLQELFIQKTDT